MLKECVVGWTLVATNSTTSEIMEMGPVMMAAGYGQACFSVKQDLQPAEDCDENSPFPRFYIEVSQLQEGVYSLNLERLDSASMDKPLTRISTVGNTFEKNVIYMGETTKGWFWSARLKRCPSSE